jgi:hypothetical protein
MTKIILIKEKEFIKEIKVKNHLHIHIIGGEKPLIYHVSNWDDGCNVVIVDLTNINNTKIEEFSV